MKTAIIVAIILTIAGANLGTTAANAIEARNNQIIELIGE